MKKIVVLTTAGNDREDGNVYYSRYLILESASLRFDEPLFKQVEEYTEKQFVMAARRLGYLVHQPEALIVEVK